MQVIRLTVSRKTYTEITVTVADDYTLPNLGTLMDSRHEPTIRRACKTNREKFEEYPDEPVEVEEVHRLQGKEAEVELKDYRHVDITESLRAADAKARGS